MKVLLDAGADATARNFAGALPHQLALEGSPSWASLLAELDWRACLEQPRPCQYTASEGKYKYCCFVPKVENKNFLRLYPSKQPISKTLIS